MVKRTGPTNQNMRNLIKDLARLGTKSKFWKVVARELEAPTRSRREVNISTINTSTKEKESVVVPGKVLSLGELDHAVTVAAWNFSAVAREKINQKGKAISISAMAKENPEGKGMRLLG